MEDIKKCLVCEKPFLGDVCSCQKVTLKVMTLPKGKPMDTFDERDRAYKKYIDFPEGFFT